MDYEKAKAALLAGKTPVDVYAEWLTANPEATAEQKNNAKQALAFAWSETRRQAIKARRKLA